VIATTMASHSNQRYNAASTNKSTSNKEEKPRVFVWVKRVKEELELPNEETVSIAAIIIERSHERASRQSNRSSVNASQELRNPPAF
jgi:hypothetical protein